MRNFRTINQTRRALPRARASVGDRRRHSVMGAQDDRRAAVAPGRLERFDLDGRFRRRVRVTDTRRLDCRKRDGRAHQVTLEARLKAAGRTTAISAVSQARTASVPRREPCKGRPRARSRRPIRRLAKLSQAPNSKLPVGTLGGGHGGISASSPRWQVARPKGPLPCRSRAPRGRRA